MTGLALLRLVVGILGGEQARPSAADVAKLAKRMKLDDENTATLAEVADRMRTTPAEQS